MGTGSLGGGRFDLTVSVRHDADGTRLTEWRESFRQASKLLFDATDGQHQFGRISVCNNSRGNDRADFRLMEDPGRSGVSFLSTGGIGANGTYATLFADERFRPFVIVHEFAHYAYGVYDEYDPATFAPLCIGGKVSDACIMESGWQDGDRFGAAGAGGALIHGRVSEFCVAVNHDPDHDTLQQVINNKSCWETMAAAPALGLTKPQGLPTAAAPGGAAEITWTLLPPDQRFVLVIDRSAHAAGRDANEPDTLAEAKLGAAWWADASLSGDVLGVVSFGGTARTDVGPIPISDDADRGAVRGAIDGLQPGGITSIADGLQAGLETILAAGPPTANQVLVLVTDGLDETDADPADALPALADNDVRVHPVGVGPLIDALLLDEIAAATGGTFHRVDPTLSRAHQGLRLRTLLQQLSATTRDNGGIVTSRPGVAGPVTPVAHRVVIEPECERATFGVVWIGDGDELELRLFSPDGAVIALDAVPDTVRPITGSRPSTGFQIERPAAGPWGVEIRRVGAGRPVDHRLVVTSENPRLDGSVRVRRGPYRPGDAVPLWVQVHHDQPVTGVAVRGVVRLPGGGTVPLRWSDEGDPTSGDLAAGDGVYSALFTETWSPGTYLVEVDVEGDGRSARHAAIGEPLYPGESFPLETVPPFQRRFETTLVIGVP